MNKKIAKSLSNEDIKNLLAKDISSESREILGKEAMRRQAKKEKYAHKGKS